MRPRPAHRDEPVAFNDHVIGIYDGRFLCGEILIGRTIRATDAAGCELGTFKNQADAQKAILAARQEGVAP
jgi:hypothetical protein